MSHWGQGWAQRQRLGDPVAKSVLQAMCYLMRDDILLVFVGIPTLCEYTEYDERTVRKAIARLADPKDLGILEDTGKRRNNMTVWRIPGYEQWLEAQKSSTDKNGRASETDASALAQVAELARQKTATDGGRGKPPQKGEGSQQAPPHLPSGPPKSAPEALPKMGGNLNTDLNRDLSADARTNPAGSRAALDANGNPFNAQVSRAYWYNHTHSLIVGYAVSYGLARYGIVRIDDLPLYPRTTLKAVFDELTEWAVAEERSAFPNFKASNRKGVESEIESRLIREMKTLRPKTAAERQAENVEAA